MKTNLEVPISVSIVNKEDKLEILEDHDIPTDKQMEQQEEDEDSK